MFDLLYNISRTDKHPERLFQTCFGICEPFSLFCNHLKPSLDHLHLENALSEMAGRFRFLEKNIFEHVLHFL